MNDNIPSKGIKVLTPEEIEDACFSARDKAWFAVAHNFDIQNENGRVTYQSLADRINRKKAQVHRWVDSSCNMTLKSLGLLAAGLDAEVVIQLQPKIKRDRENYCHPAEAAANNIAFKTTYLDLQNAKSTSSSSRSPASNVVNRFTYEIEEPA